MKNNKIEFLFYKGKSLVSKIIKFKTNGIYSHVAIKIDGTVYEAWHRVGVIKSSCERTFHKKNTEIDIVEFYYDYLIIEEFKNFLENQIGKKYDFYAIFNFLRNCQKENPNKWFCSELASTFFIFVFKNYSIKNKLISPQMFYENINIFKNSLYLK